MQVSDRRHVRMHVRMHVMNVHNMCNITHRIYVQTERNTKGESNDYKNSLKLLLLHEQR